MPPEQDLQIPFEPGFPVAVVIAYGPQAEDAQEAPVGEVVGVVAGAATEGEGLGSVLIHSGAGGEQYMWTGFRLQLHRDDAESYYFNLVSDRPSVFVICRPGRDRRLVPALLTLSYDAAAAYMEVDELVFRVAMPAEVYRWAESFVMQHYVPERKKKRRRDDWKQGSERR
jgi:hypothetical protein